MNSYLILMLQLTAILLAILVIPGIFLLTALTLGGIFPVRRPNAPAAGGRLIFLVPAHNEQFSIDRTVNNLKQEAERDGASEVVVIADNCSDHTAYCARAAGAHVLERQDLQRRGKGYALDFGFRHLLNNPEYADVMFFVVIDADSEVEPGFLHSFRCHFGAGAMALQARYSVLNADASVRTRLMHLALGAFNVLRPRGRAALGCSAGLLGNGFGLRREIIQEIPYAAGSIVEDIEYHLLLIWHGIRVQFADDAMVRADMPVQQQSAKSQRARWEGGRLRLLIDHAPGLCRDVLRGRRGAIEPLLDLLLLPLSFHLSLLCLLLAMPFEWSQVLALSGLGVLLIHVLAAAHVAAVPLRHLTALFFLPIYLLWKFAQLNQILSAAKSNAMWLRTPRSPQKTVTQKEGAKS